MLLIQHYLHRNIHGGGLSNDKWFVVKCVRKRMCLCIYYKQYFMVVYLINANVVNNKF